MQLKAQPGPQTEFAQCPADVAIFASSPGSGKSYIGVLEALRWSHLPRYTGVLLRQNHKELMRGSSSLFGMVSTFGKQMGGHPKQAPYPMVEFPHAEGTSTVLCMHGNTPKTAFDGIEIAFSFWDELDHFDFELFQYVTGSRSRTTCGVRPYVRASTMPQADTWVRELVTPWLEVHSESEAFPDLTQSGRVRWFFHDHRDLPQIFDTREDAIDAAKAVDTRLKPRSLTFIFANTTHNKVLMAADPEYLDRLSNLSSYERSRLLGQNWNSRPSSAGMFDRSKWRVFDEPIRPKEIKQSVRGWDLASTLPSDANTDPDWTRGVRLDTTAGDFVCVSDVVSKRDRPGPVNDLLRAVARADGPKVTQAFCRDPGAAGVRDEAQIRQVLADVPGCGPLAFETSANKVSLASVWSAWLDAGRMGLLRAAWNGPYLAELDKFPSNSRKDHDDQVDGTSYAFRELHLDLPPAVSASSLLLSRL